MDITAVANGMGITVEELDAIIQRITRAWEDFAAKFQEACAAIADALKPLFDFVQDEQKKSGFHPEWQSRRHKLTPYFSRFPDAKLGKQYTFKYVHPLR